MACAVCGEKEIYGWVRLSSKLLRKSVQREECDRCMQSAAKDSTLTLRAYNQLVKESAA
jgi:hypothetical protein